MHVFFSGTFHMYLVIDFVGILVDFASWNNPHEENSRQKHQLYEELGY